MNIRCRSFNLGHGIGILRLCTALGSNKLLRGNSYHQSVQSHPILWGCFGVLNLRWLLSEERDIDPFFHFPFRGPDVSGCHCGASSFHTS